MPAWMYGKDGKKKDKYRGDTGDKAGDDAVKRKRMRNEAMGDMAPLKGSRRRIKKVTREDGEARMKMGAAS